MRLLFLDESGRIGQDGLFALGRVDAVERLDGQSADTATLERYIEAVGSGATVRQLSAGRGENIRLRGVGAVGSGLALDDELVQLSAFTR